MFTLRLGGSPSTERWFDSWTSVTEDEVMTVTRRCEPEHESRRKAEQARVTMERETAYRHVRNPQSRVKYVRSFYPVNQSSLLLTVSLLELRSTKSPIFTVKTSLKWWREKDEKATAAFPAAIGDGPITTTISSKAPIQRSIRPRAS